MDSFDKDKKFLIEVIEKIVNYAKDNGMEPDETIKTIAENMINLLEISTFNNYVVKGKK